MFSFNDNSIIHAEHVIMTLQLTTSLMNNAGERCVLLPQWVGEAWEELSTKEEMIIRSFKKCGVSVAADGSEDFAIHLEGVEDY